MGEKVVIPIATFKRLRACGAAYNSPEYDAEQDAVVFSDWDKTVERLLAKGRQGLNEIDWCVAHKLVPMTREEFVVLKKKFYEDQKKDTTNG